MKKLLFILSACVIIALSSMMVFAMEGDGTEEAPFLITNQGELELVTDFPDCHFRLNNDIVLEGAWIPLCKQTPSGYFTGVFDGAGYTISNLSVIDGAYGGLFKTNRGIIKDTVVKGDISGEHYYVGGICADNYGTVMRCKFEGSIENTYGIGYTGGICGYNLEVIENCAVSSDIIGQYYTGGICGCNSTATISNCYFIGSIDSDSYKGGIVGYSSGSTYYKEYSYITDCYAASRLGSDGYGITGQDGKYVSVTTSYYDKTISGLTSTSYGTPKSSAAMKMKQIYENDWDFENTWGIDKNINNGYPYLLWEYPDVEEHGPYTVNSIKITDLSGNELTKIPDKNFYFEINVTKNDNLKNADSLIIAIYDENGTFIDVKYMSGTYYKNQTMAFGALINKTDRKIGNIKGFVWNNVFGMVPLSNTMEIVK